MTDLKIKEETANYTIFEAKYKNTIQIFRKWTATQIIEIRFSDDFARANGFQNRADMFRKEPEMRRQIALLCGIVPEWIQIINNEFCVKTNTSMN